MTIRPHSTVVGLLVVTSAGCQALLGLPSAETTVLDSAIDSASIDGAPRRCDVTKAFADVRPVAGVNSADGEFNVSLSPDELTIYFASNRNAPGSANFDLFVATRTSRDDTFGTPAAMTGVNTGADERGPSISADGLSLFFHSSRNAGTSYDVFVSTRANTAASFDAAATTALGTDIDTAVIEEAPFITADGQNLYFDRSPTSDTTTALMRASLGPTGFASPVAVAELNAAVAYNAVLSADELTIFFASPRAGGLGSDDIWTATRSTPTGTFVDITDVAELNTTDLDRPGSVSPDGCRMYFWSSRSGGLGHADIWQATRPQ